MRTLTELMCLVAALDHLLETKNEVRERDRRAPCTDLPSLFQVRRQDNVSVLSYGYTLVSYGQIKKPWRTIPCKPAAWQMEAISAEDIRSGRDTSGHIR